ncbi:MAG: hypothetical protein IJJ00_02565 [Erysipelotrichaceae bacterium]|nr:hypothetical protein [Erysipelotrichaceae bacterium]
MAEEIQAQNIYGLGIFHDKLKRTVYSGPFMKDGYVISDKNAKVFRYYRMRLMGAFLAMVAGALVFDKNYLAGTIVGVIFYIVTTLMFYFLFLPKCPVIHNYLKPKQNIIKNLANAQSMKRIIFTVVSIVVLASMLFIIATTMTGYDKFFCNVIAIAAMIFAYANVLAIFYKIRHKEYDEGEHLTEEEIQRNKKIKKVNDL